MSNTLEFTVTVSAAEWAEIQRRLRFVEAALVQALRGERKLKEWFSASELLGLALPGLPRTRQGILRKAQAEHWQLRTMYGQGGARYEFHFATLPRRAFEMVLQRIVAALPQDGSQSPAQSTEAPEALALPLPVRAVNATPPWLLPLLRVIRSDRISDAETLTRHLAKQLPKGMERPTADQVQEAIRQFGH